LLDAHVAYKSAIGDHDFAPAPGGDGAFALSTGVAGKTYLQCLTGTTSGTGTGVTSVVNELLTYKVAIKNRITEISNRIGYLNGKGSHTGGIADGGNGTQSAGHSTAYGGFAGTDFNGGKGYANTIYSHANFLAGKKINLLGKVLKAIVAVQVMYDSVEKKRSEYYEYNQAS